MILPEEVCEEMILLAEHNSRESYEFCSIVSQEWFEARPKVVQFWLRALIWRWQEVRSFDRYSPLDANCANSAASDELWWRGSSRNF